MLVAVTGYLFLFQIRAVIPPLIRINVGEKVELGTLFPDYLAKRIFALIDDGEGNLIWEEEGFLLGSTQAAMEKAPIAAAPGLFKLELRLFGFVPLKKVILQVITPVKVMAGGQSIGVILNSTGVLVVGYSNIPGVLGTGSCPAREAGIMPGDLIIKVENATVHSDVQMSFLIDELARKREQIRLQVKRGGHLREYWVKPEFCRDTRRYRIGLLVRDGAAGVGTLTFYEAQTKKFGALGHEITDSESGRALDLSDGKIVMASVQGIQKGERSRIGEKIGVFFNESGVSGSITKNTKYGIFGTLHRDLTNPFFSHPLPVAMSSQVHEGTATMLTVLSGETIEAFQIYIKTVFPRPRPDGKSFIIEITDPDLLRRTGGIIRGMSGSPIIQNGKLVGAVTHVFVNDHKRGYGVLAELMLEEVGLIPATKNSAPNSLLLNKDAKPFLKPAYYPRCSPL